MTHPSRRDGQAVVASLHRALTPPRRSNIMTGIWRWRWELGLSAALAAVAVPLVGAVGPVWTTVILTASLVAACAVPASRRWLAARMWVVVVPHRVRQACRQCMIFDLDGRLPAIMRTVARPWGEEVVLWCQAGLSAADFEGHEERLAAACFAAEVRVERDPLRAFRVSLHVRRR